MPNISDLSLHILDIGENSVRAGATLIKISLTELRGSGKLTLTVRDNGRGIPKELLPKVLLPGVSGWDTPSGGMGLFLLRESAEKTGGCLSLRSRPGRGTAVRAVFVRSSPKMPPMGSLPETFFALLTLHPDRDFALKLSLPGKRFSLNTKTLRRRLKAVPLSAPQVVLWLRREMEGFQTN